MTHMSAPEVAPKNVGKEQPVSVARWRLPLGLAIAALVIAVIAAVVSVVAWLNPGGPHSYSGQQSAQAKTTVCAAWSPVRKSVWEVTPNPRPDDPVSADAVAANVRLAMIGGGLYLKETVASQPAASGDLANAVNSVADTLQRMGIVYLSRTASPAVINPLQHDLDSQGAQVDKLCGKAK